MNLYVARIWTIEWALNPPAVVLWHQFFEFCTWSNLRALEFFGDIPEGGLVMNHFLTRHPNLEELGCFAGTLIDLSPNFLPNLRVLKTCVWNIPQILEATPSLVLHTVEIELRLFDHSRVDLLATTLRDRPSLKHLIYMRPFVRTSASNVFQCRADVEDVERLRVYRRFGTAVSFLPIFVQELLELNCLILYSSELINCRTRWAIEKIDMIPTIPQV